MSEFLKKTFYGNTVMDWAIAILIICAGFILAKVFYWIISRIIKKLTKKTKTKLDDIIVDMIEEPIAFAIIIAGFWFGIGHLEFQSPSIMIVVRHIYIFLITFNVAWLITRLLDAIIEEYMVPMVEKSKGDFDDQLLPVVRKALKVTVWAVAIVVGLNNAGYDVGALIAGLGIGGLAFAMAAKDSVANLFGGFTIFTDKPFVINDRIKIDGFDGTIKEIGIRSTRLQTLEGRIVTIPNAHFSSRSIENISSEPSRKVTLNLGLTYDTTPEAMEKAMKILQDITAANPALEEKTIIGFNEFNDSSMNIVYMYYIKKEADIVETQTAVNLEILKQFNANKLEFAFPTQTILTQKV